MSWHVFGVFLPKEWGQEVISACAVNGIVVYGTFLIKKQNWKSRWGIAFPYHWKKGWVFLMLPDFQAVWMAKEMRIFWFPCSSVIVKTWRRCVENKPCCFSCPVEEILVSWEWCVSDIVPCFLPAVISFGYWVFWIIFLSVSNLNKYTCALQNSAFNNVPVLRPCPYVTFLSCSDQAESRVVGGVQCLLSFNLPPLMLFLLESRAEYFIYFYVYYWTEGVSVMRVSLQ